MQLVWEEFLKIIKEEAGSQVVETWFKAVSLKEWNAKNKIANLQTPNQFVSKWLQEHYSELITKTLCRLLHLNKISLTFTCNPSTTKNIIPASIIHPKNNNENKEAKITSNLNKKENKIVVHKKKFGIETSKRFNRNKPNNLNSAYTFNSFVVGPSNSLAHAAGYAVCQNLGKIYNPLFIYGGTGLGKTHLLHAIGNEAKAINPRSSILYQTTDKFTNEFINSIRFNKTNQFREKYKKIDLILLDDIQFLSNKEQTQESFFHIFNILYEQKKQIILSSDTFPKEIKGLQNRLRSRLEWGLVVDIQIPDLETKIAILKKKSIQHSININNEVANFIASRITSNIRELEGAMIRVGAFATLTNKSITLELAKKVLLHLNQKNKKEGMMIEKVFKQVAKYYSMPISHLKSKKRQKNITLVRQVAFYMMKKLTFCSLQSIGEYVGKRDHSTVLHAISKVESLINTDKNFAQKLNDIEQKILMS